MRKSYIGINWLDVEGFGGSGDRGQLTLVVLLVHPDYQTIDLLHAQVQRWTAPFCHNCSLTAC